MKPEVESLEHEPLESGIYTVFLNQEVESLEHEPLESGVYTIFLKPEVESLEHELLESGDIWGLYPIFETRS